MTGYKSDYLIQFYGAYYEEGIIRLVLELMDVGSFRDVLTVLQTN